MNKLFGFKRGQKGFTLIELLIVIAILGILVAVAIPSIMGMVKTGKVGAANSELASAKTAAIAYLADNPTNASPFSSTTLGNYLSNALKGVYWFDKSGTIIEADGTGVKAPVYYTDETHATADTDVTWDAAKHQFKKG